MTLVFLIRHAHSTANGSGILSGRTEGVHLSPAGRKQARQLATRLGNIPIKILLSSPLERCQETISPWLNAQDEVNPRLRLKIDPDLAEVDYGDWTGRGLRELAKEPLWKKIQETPSKVTFPHGESMLKMQARAFTSLQNAVAKAGKGHVILISHGDVLKSLVASALNLHLDEFQRIVIDPASISILDFREDTSRLLLMNDTRSRLKVEHFATKEKRLLVGGGSGIQPHVPKRKGK